MLRKTLTQPVIDTYNTRAVKIIYPKINTTKYYDSCLITGLKLFERFPLLYKIVKTLIPLNY